MIDQWEDLQLQRDITYCRKITSNYLFNSELSTVAQNLQALEVKIEYSLINLISFSTHCFENLKKKFTKLA
ncbi:Ribosome-binding factor [Trichinella spiralis]|uniref:Ribosome-binding factor n=1 Tax=Trichinella spiralis TaxID=6334 RepID=A0ABR3L3D7_TRISP